ncbi:MAG: T9SS type A sorting domain-containing protein [Balneolaceae bacterium]|nr:T9SS type A sorting domain-containing protein [Balneolaceae bacterium]
MANTVQAQSFAGGDGESPETAFQIETWKHLDNVRDHLSSYFILNNNLDENTDGYDEFASETANSENGWIPIRSGSGIGIILKSFPGNGAGIETDDEEDISVCFRGNFNGNGNTISDLYSLNTFNTGLFACIEDAEVYDLTLNNIDVTGFIATGGLAGQSINSSISNVSVNGTVSGLFFTGSIVAVNEQGVISGSSSSGEILADTGAGGIAAVNIGTINSSSSSADILNDFSAGPPILQKMPDDFSLDHFPTLTFSSDEHDDESGLFGGFGGLVGFNNGVISNSFATGDLVIGFSEIILLNEPAKLMSNPFELMQNGEFYLRPDDEELQYSSGGLVGINTGLIARSYSTGTVVNTVVVAGGLVGVNAEFSEILFKSIPYSGGSNSMIDFGLDYGIIDSYSVSNVATVAFGGGLVGYLIGGEVRNTYAAGELEMLPPEFIFKQVGEIDQGNVEEFDFEDTFGGLIGINDALLVSKSVGSTSPSQGGIMLDDYPNIVNSFWDTQTTGFDVSQGGTGKPTSQMKTIFTFTDTDTPGLNESWNFSDLWTIDPNPFISYPYFGEGSGAPRQDPSPGLEISDEFLSSRITVPSGQTTVIDDTAIILGIDTDIDITGIGPNGVFELNGSPLSVGDDPTRGEIESGMLTFNPDVGSSKLAYGYNYSFLEYSTSAGDFILHIDLAALAIPYEIANGWILTASPSIDQEIGDFLSTNTTVGFPGSTNPSDPFPSVYTLDQEAYDWVAASSSSQQMEVGKSLLTFIFPEDTPKAEMFHSPGPWLPLDGTFTFDEFLGYDLDQGEFGDSHFLIGNPHPIAIDYCQMLLREPTLANSIDIWFPEANDGNGGYVNYGCFLVQKEFSTSSGELIPSLFFVEPLMGFWVRTLEENPSLSVLEEDYVSYGEFTLLKEDKLGLEPLTLALKHNDRNYANLLHVLLSSEGTFELDAFDAIKLSSKGLAERYLSFFAMDEGGRKFATRSLPDTFTDDIQIPLAIETTEAGSYTIEWNVPAEYAGINFSLRDNHTGEEVVLRNGMSYTFTLSDDETDAVADNSARSIGDISLNKEASSVEPRFILTASMFGNGGPDELPAAVALSQNYPNPFNPSTIIQYQLPQTSHVSLQVFDMAGRRVAQLVNEQISAGTHTVTFDASNLSSGVYMYRLQARSTTLTRKLTVIK